jgi:putative membrane protein
MNFLLQWVVYTLAIVITAYFLPGVHITGIMAAFFAAVIIGLVNAFIRPVLIILTLPINIVTFGLFILVINALLIMLSAWLVPGFVINGFWWAILFGIVLAIVSCFLSGIIKTFATR